jgi:hypothetical protein
MTNRTNDGVSFVHIYSSESDSGARALPELPGAA